MKFGQRPVVLLAAATVAGLVVAVAAWLNSTSIMKTKLPDLKEPAIVIRKRTRVLEVYDGGRLVSSFSTVLGSSPELDKEVEGDGRTPEGEFYVFVKNPKSRFHLSLGLSYPTPDDAERGLADGLISREEHDAIIKAASEKKMPPQKTRLGGEIYIHGGGISRNWTHGCIALENDEMTALFEVIPVGTRVTILK